jgi:hypothetical protein
VRRLWKLLTGPIDGIGAMRNRAATVAFVISAVGGTGVLTAVLRAFTRLSTPWLVTFGVGFTLLLVLLEPVRQWERRQTEAKRLALGQECLDLAQDATRFLGDLKRDRPARITELGLDLDERNRAWEKASREDHDYRMRSEARFNERFLVRIAGLLQALKEQGVLSEPEENHIAWIFRNEGPPDQIASLLGAKARELGVKAAP